MLRGLGGRRPPVEERGDVRMMFVDDGWEGTFADGEPLVVGARSNSCRSSSLTELGVSARADLYRSKVSLRLIRS